MKKTIRLDGKRHELTLAIQGTTFRIEEGDRFTEGTRHWNGAALALGVAGGDDLHAHVVRGAGGQLELWIDSERHVVEEEGRAAGSSSSTRESDTLATPMPAKVVRVNVAAGDRVTAGQTLIVVESMKMELGLTAPRDGVVATVTAVPGVLVVAGAVLVALEPKEPMS